MDWLIIWGFKHIIQNNCQRIQWPDWNLISFFVMSINLVTVRNNTANWTKSVPQVTAVRHSRSDRRDNAPQVQARRKFSGTNCPFHCEITSCGSRVKCQAEPTGARRADNGASAAWLDPRLPRPPITPPRSLCTPVTCNLHPTFHFINLFVAARRKKEPIGASCANLQRHWCRLAEPKADLCCRKSQQEIWWQQSDPFGQQT